MDNEEKEIEHLSKELKEAHGQFPVVNEEKSKKETEEGKPDEIKEGKPSDEPKEIPEGAKETEEGLEESEEEPEGETVPLAEYLDVKKLNKVLKKKVEEFELKLSELKEAETRQERKEIIEEIKPLADELKADPDVLSKIISKAVEIAERRFSDKLPKSLPELEETAETQKEFAYFESEWSAFLPTLTKNYPNATAEQLQSAKGKMDDISHSEQGGKVIVVDGKERLNPYDLDYIFYKNQKEFDSLLRNPKKRGLETSGPAPFPEEEEELPENPTTSQDFDKLDAAYRRAEHAGETTIMRQGKRITF